MRLSFVYAELSYYTLLCFTCATVLWGETPCKWGKSTGEITRVRDGVDGVEECQMRCVELSWSAESESTLRLSTSCLLAWPSCLTSTSS